jgi:hypothetical protein
MMDVLHARDPWLCCGCCFTGAACMDTAFSCSRFGDPRVCEEGPGSLIPGIPVGGGY